MNPLEAFAILYLATLEVRRFRTKDELINAIKDAGTNVLPFKYHPEAGVYVVMDQSVW